MPQFYFILKNGRESVPDREGEELADQNSARAHARAVAQELMHHRERATRMWRLEVRDNDLRHLVEVPFVSIDQSIAHLPEPIRREMEVVCAKAGSLSDAICNLQWTMAEVRETMARARQLPPIDLFGRRI